MLVFGLADMCVMMGCARDDGSVFASFLGLFSSSLQQLSFEPLLSSPCFSGLLFGFFLGTQLALFGSLSLLSLPRGLLGAIPDIGLLGWLGRLGLWRRLDQIFLLDLEFELSRPRATERLGSLPPIK
jgi:hypothetical protein